MNLHLYAKEVKSWETNLAWLQCCLVCHRRASQFENRVWLLWKMATALQVINGKCLIALCYLPLPQTDTRTTKTNVPKDTLKSGWSWWETCNILLKAEPLFLYTTSTTQCVNYNVFVLFITTKMSVLVIFQRGIALETPQTILISNRHQINIPVVAIISLSVEIWLSCLFCKNCMQFIIKPLYQQIE